jgi:hypothetical protein
VLGDPVLSVCVLVNFFVSGATLVHQPYIVVPFFISHWLMSLFPLRTRTIDTVEADVEGAHQRQQSQGAHACS